MRNRYFEKWIMPVLISLVFAVLSSSSVLAQPILLTPAYYENTNDNTPFFSWLRSSEEENYRMVICRDLGGIPNPSDNVYDRWLTENFDNFDVHPQDSLADGLWWWGVRIENQPGGLVGSWVWGIFRIDTIAPAMPKLSFPSNGENTNILKIKLENLQRENSYPLVCEFKLRQVDNSLFESVDRVIVSSSIYTDNLVVKVSVGEVSPPLVYFYASWKGQSWCYIHRYSWWIENVLISVGLDVECDLENVIENFVYYRWCPLPQDGLYNLSLAIRDNAGNVVELESRVFRLDTIAPSPPSLLFPSDGALLNLTAPTLVWQPVSENSLPVRYWVEVDTSPSFDTWNRLLWESASSSSLTPRLFEGTWYWRVRAIDGAWNFGNWSAVRKFTLDLTSPPSPSLLSAPPSFSKSKTVAFTWSPVSDVHGVIYCYMLVGLDSNWRTTSSTSVIYKDIPDGHYLFKLKARDNAGNESQVLEYPFTVDTTPPILFLTGTLSSASLTPLGWMYISSSPYLALEGKTEPSCKAYLNDIPISIRADGSFSELVSLVPGVNYFTLRIIDTAGNILIRRLEVYYVTMVAAPPSSNMPGEMMFAIAAFGSVLTISLIIKRNVSKR
jgi:hypothetical protein